MYKVKTNNEAQVEGLLMRNKLEFILDNEVERFKFYDVEVEKRRYISGVEIVYNFTNKIRVCVNDVYFYLDAPQITLGGFWISINVYEHIDGEYYARNPFSTTLYFEDIKSFDIS